MDREAGSPSAKRPKMELEPEKPNHILLLTVLNPNYPITCEVLHTICSPIGTVNRIVIFRKNGMQAMVEFDKVETATKAKEELQGCNIYADCCMLKIEFAKQTKLNVYKNDLDTWDFTNPDLGAGKGAYGQQGSYASTAFNQRPVLLGEPSANPSSMSASVSRQGMSPSPYQHRQGAVCMVYGLSQEKMNPNRIFNLFCVYGNVVRVKFLKTKEGCAMVQMGDGPSVERVVSNLNNAIFFGSKMQLSFSKQAFLSEVQSSYQLPDGSNSFQDFMGSRNNRFTNPKKASKISRSPPSKVLHFFNTPPGLDHSDIDNILTTNGSPKPKNVKMFPSKTERSSSGLIEFETLPEALEGLVLCNHQPIPNPNGQFPYIMKLCFSRNVAS